MSGASSRDRRDVEAPAGVPPGEFDGHPASGHEAVDAPEVASGRADATVAASGRADATSVAPSRADATSVAPSRAEATDAGSTGTGTGGTGSIERRSLRSQVTRLRLQARRGRVGRLAVAVAVALVLGVAFGRITAPDSGAEVRPLVEASVLAIALEADGIWTAGSDGRAAVSDGLVALRRDGDPTIVADNLDAWLVAYDAAIVRVAGVDLAGPGRAVQRQLITALTLSRDAVEVLGHAATVEDGLLRTDLTTEVGRLRSRSEQLIQSARASTAELDGGRTDVSPLPQLRNFQDGRRS